MPTTFLVWVVWVVWVVRVDGPFFVSRLHVGMASMIALWVIALVACVGGTSFASRRAVTSALRIADSVNVSPAVVGLTVMSIGTDLPEIANSIVSSWSGHGDVNVGDSMGSALTQVTLTLGILCLASGEITTNKNFVIGVGTVTVFSVTLVRILANDGELARRDGLLLILLWVVGTALLGHEELRPRDVFVKNGGAPIGLNLLATLGWLAVVGALAIGVVQSFLRIAETLGIPEFIGSFVALSIGTSLPELFVDWTAIKRGASSMAIGDVFGSSFVDATLSVGIGPALFASMVSTDVFTGTELAAGGVAIATILVARFKRYDWRLAVPLLATYGCVQTAAALLVR